MKKILIALLVLSLTFTICGCGKSGKDLEQEICNSLSGKKFEAEVEDWGYRYCEFGDDGHVREYSYENDGESDSDFDYYYEVRKIGDDQYAIDTATSEDSLFFNEDYRFIVTDIEGTQITGFKGSENLEIEGIQFNDDVYKLVTQ